MAHVIRCDPGMASVVSAKVFSGSRPETKVSEQRMLATYPVATIGTSRARAAVNTSAASTAVVANIKNRRRLVMAFSGVRIGACAHEARASARPLAEFGKGAH